MTSIIFQVLMTICLCALVLGAPSPRQNAPQVVSHCIQHKTVALTFVGSTVFLDDLTNPA